MKTYLKTSNDFWLTGTEGASRTLVLFDQLFSNALIACNQSCDKKFESYEPWMTGALAGHYNWSSAATSPAGVPIAKKSTLFEVCRAVDDGLKLAMGDEEKSVQIYPSYLEDYPQSNENYQLAWDLIQKTESFLAVLSRKIVKLIVPIASTKIGFWSGNSASSCKAIGAIFVGMPLKNDAYVDIDLAVSFAHELGHQILMAYQRSDRILVGSLETPIYSGTRKSLRPAIRSVHAAVALAFMQECCSQLHCQLQDEPDRDKYLKDLFKEFNLALKDTVTGMSQLAFTDFGIELYQELGLLTKKSI